MLNNKKEYHLTLFSKGQEIDDSFYSTDTNIKEMNTSEIVNELKSNSTYSHKFLDTVDNITLMDGFVSS